MGDQELAAIRAARLSQLQQSSPSGKSGEADDNEIEAQDATAAKRNAEEQMRRDLLATVLDSAARERLARIALVSPTRSNQIESILVRMAQTGQLRGRIGEEQLINLLEQAEDAQLKTAAKKAPIVYHRRKEAAEDDDFDI